MHSRIQLLSLDFDGTLVSRVGEPALDERCMELIRALQEGGAVFRVELPAVLAAFPAKELQQLTTQGSNPRKPG